jgi:hypothetical protein
MAKATAEVKLQEPPTAVETALAEVPKDTAVAKAESLDDLFREDAGGGLKNLGANDFAIPFISVLQKGSPQVSKNNAKYVKGAEQGMFFNTLTGDLYPGNNEGDVEGDALPGILVIPCGYQKQLVRWKPRDSGGGLVCHYNENDPAIKTFTRNERGQLTDKGSGDIIIDTAYHFCLLLHEGGFPEFAVISMASTQLKKSRTWNTVMRRIMVKTPNGELYNPPSYSQVYRIKTIGEVKDNYDWYGLLITSEGKVTDINVYKMAREFAKQVESGNVRVSAPPQDFDDAAAPANKEDVPF